MYSVVLMAALTTGTAASPAWGCHGCHGCCGGCWSSCHGCSGSCWGGCHGCWGGCHGCSGCHGCWGGCNGCWGGCYGSWSCHGGCYGSYYGGCNGGYCYGGCYGGCWGGCNGSPAHPPAQAVPPPPAGAKPAEGVPAPKTTQVTPAPARVTVILPEDARLYVDEQLMKTTSANRVFRTPELEPGATYYYTVRAEVIRDGQKQTRTKQILVHAGEEVRTSFPDLEAVSTVRAGLAAKP